MNMSFKLVLGLLMMVMLAVTVHAPVQAQSPTPEQLRMLRQLPESQRQELMRSMGISEADVRPRREDEIEFPETVRRPETQPEEPEGPPRLEAGSTIIVRLQLPRIEEQNGTTQGLGSRPQQRADLSAQVSDPDLREQQEFAQVGAPGRVDPELERRFQERLERNPQLGRVLGALSYVLDPEGRIHFPGVATIRLAGLNEYQAARRIEAEPNLRPLRAEVLLLPLEPFGVDALEPFGYELFEGAPVTFAPATDVPVPADYVVGPGDEVRVQLFGNESAIHHLVVNRDGSLNFPRIGPIVVAGMGFREMRELLERRVSEQMIGVTASITMGELRSIRVFVLGDVTRPGSFTVSGLSTMTNALFVSGGVTLAGSLRNVQLKRNGQTIQRLDLYDLLLNGDNSADARLMPNDVLFVPPRGATVAVAGEVQRPAIYEISGERTLDAVVRLAGGLLSTAYSGAARLERVNQAGGRSVYTIDLEAPAGKATALRGGDHVTVSSVPADVLIDHVTLAGHVRRAGPFEWRPGMRLSDLIGSVNALKPDADRNYVLIRRQADLSGPIDVLSADLAAALAAPGGAADPLLHNLDTVTVFDLGSGRTSIIGPVMRQLRMQAVHGSPAREVQVTGMVRAPGTYPLEDGMRASDLIRAGASLTDSAYGLTAELTRYQVEGGSRRVVALEELDLAAILAGDPGADIVLQPFDHLNVQQISQWRRRGTVVLEGEVKFPGTYPFEPGETLSNVLARAGGLTDLAFPEGSVFLREGLRQREREEIERLITRLEADIATMTLQSARAAAIQGGRGETSIGVGQALLTQLRRAEPVGRLVIDLPGVVAGRKDVDITLRDGDRLLVPERSQEVMVLGEVQYATSHLYRPGLRRNDYVSASGGMTVNADGRRIYVVRANGAVVAGDPRGKWFQQGANMDIRPGDTIVVPMDVDRVPALALWQSSTSILYNLAIAVAAIGSL
jgi:polysaccharide biosynthesis/export protein